MNRRPQLRSKFKELLKNNNVYFQPPEDLKMEFPCIRYKLSDIETWKANNKLYNHMQCYEVVYITRKPDDSLVDEILKAFDFISFTNAMCVNDLWHYRYKLYY